MKNFRKARLKERQNLAKGHRSRRDDRARLDMQETVVQQQLDVKLLQWLSERPELNERHRTEVNDALQWVQAVDRRTLGSRRRFYLILETLLIKGKYDPNSRADEESIRRYESRASLRAMRKSEQAGQVPDWMADRSKLPRKPPGK